MTRSNNLIKYYLVDVIRIFLFQIVFFGVTSYAQNLKVVVSGEFPYVYSGPDFNAPVIAQLEIGKVYFISQKKYAEVFYQISVKPGMVGYISDAEVKVVGAASKLQNSIRKPIRKPISIQGQSSKRVSRKKNSESDQKMKIEPARKSFERSRYRGLVLEQINYTEDTMGKVRTKPLLFVGFRVCGDNTLFSGELPTDTTILLYNGAPKYYEEVTGHGASGWILHADFTFDTLYPQSKNHMLYYGFGPMFRFSHFMTTLDSTRSGFTIDYPMDDMALGALIKVGLAFRISEWAIRSDIKYYFEVKNYSAFNLALLYEF